MRSKSAHIPGIHNYCDRWCERCYFTNRCAVAEAETNLTREQQDIHNKAFWDHLTDNFRKAVEMLAKAAEQHGIDMTPPTPEETAAENKNEKKKRRIMDKTPVVSLSKQYSDLALKWLGETNLDEKGKELISHLEMGIISERQTENEVVTINDCIEIIQWYVHFIAIKFMRALSGKMEDDGWERENGFQRDFDGSAKIALISVSRTMEAWTKLYDAGLLNEDDMIQMLSLLERIKKEGEKEFPEAYSFIRPGFDE